MPISQTKLFYSAQKNFRDDYTSHMAGILNTILAILRRYSGQDDTIPMRSANQVITEAQDTLTREYVENGNTLNSAYGLLLLSYARNVSSGVVEANQAFMRDNLSTDLVNWLSSSQVRPSYDPFHLWVSPSGYNLSDRIWRSTVEARQKLDKYLTQNISLGTSASHMARDLENMLLPERSVLRTTRPYGVDVSFDSMRLARTEISRAHTETTFIAAEANPFVAGMDWALSAQHPRIDICDSIATIGMGGERLRDPYPVDEAPHVVSDSHPQCVLGDTLITFPNNPIKATKALYSGLVTELTTQSGRKVTVTPNHPVLTFRGWVAAQHLNKGDYVFSRKNAQRIESTISPDNNNMPTVAQEIFSAFEKSSGVPAICVPTATEDFHGDSIGFNGKVNIVDANGFLRSTENVVMPQIILKNDLISRYVTRIALNGYSRFNQARATRGSTTNRLISVFSHGFSSILRHLSIHEGLRLIKGSNFYSRFNESLFKDFSTITSTSIDGKETLSIGISSDKIIKIRNYNYFGHVFNFQVDSDNWYYANDIIVHNCICTNRPYVADINETRDELETMRLRGEPAPLTPLAIGFIGYILNRFNTD